MALIYRQVIGTYVNSDGSPKVGYVEFTPSTYLTLSGAGLSPVGSFEAWLDAEGKFSVQLLCTDSPDVAPGGWKWIVEEKIKNGNTGYLTLPDGQGPLDITYSLISLTNPPIYGEPLQVQAPANNGSYAVDLPAVIAGIPITVNHNLNTYDVVVEVHRKDTASPNASTSDLVEVDIETVTANSIRLTFTNSAAAAAYRVVTLSAGGNIPAALSVSGSRAGNAALTSLIDQLEILGLIVDNTTA